MKNRLLALYDLSSQPYSVGDMILFQAINLALATHTQLSHIDMGFILNFDRRSVDPVFAQRINPDNARHNLFKILPVVQFNPMLGSVFIWETDREAQSFLQQTPYGGVWPELGNRQYYYYPAMAIWRKYYQIHGHIPFLNPPKNLWRWAKHFCTQYSAFAVPITVNIRNNGGFGQDRNSTLDIWLYFFDYCAGRYPVKFIIICGITEVDPRMRNLPNVVIAKDQHTSLVQDLALISTAGAHFGTASGPAALVIVDEPQIPMAIFNADMKPHLHQFGDALHVEPEYAQYVFSSPHQRTWFIPETLDLLIAEFERIWALIDTEKWLAERSLDQ